MNRIISLIQQSFAFRVLMCVLAGTLLAWIFSEGAFLLLRDTSDRAPRRVELVIPVGTAERIAAGQPVPTIPTDMKFVVGDTLIVRNQDNVSHQLGPIWVPAGASGALALDRESSLSYECTFQPSKYFGLDVRPRVTTDTRIQAILLAGLPMAALLFAYSFAAYPVRKIKPT